jgi:hypothetical protein
MKQLFLITTMLIKFLLINIANCQAQDKEITLVNENNFKAKYLFGDSFVKFIIITSGSPIVVVDLNHNKKIDAYIDREYSSMPDGKSLCAVVLMEDNNTTPCGQATKATLSVSGSEYTFIIPHNELTYLQNDPYFITFKLWDGSNTSYFPRDKISAPFILDRNNQITIVSSANNVPSKQQSNFESRKVSYSSNNQNSYHKAIALDPDGIMANYGYAPVQESASSNSEIIGKVHDQEKFWAIPSSDSWLAVKLNSGVTGYMYYSRIKFINEDDHNSNKDKNINTDEMPLILNILGGSINSDKLTCSRKTCNKEFCCGWEHSSSSNCKEACITGVKCRGDYCSQYCCEKD